MLGLVELTGFPPHPFEGACIIVCALFLGLRSRRTKRSYLFAIQAALVACLISTAGLSLQDDDAGSGKVFEAVLQINFGQIMMFWLMSWLIIALIFTIRGRNDSGNIFTRNRTR